MATSISVPVLAATLSFVTYTSTTGHFNVAIIFSSLSLFQLLRQPLMFLPRALAAIPDARSALARLELVFHAELMNGAALEINPHQELALEVKGVTFEWEEMHIPAAEAKGKGAKKQEVKEEKPEMRTPFKVEITDMRVSRGSLVAIVGPVGSGKVSPRLVPHCTCLSRAVEFASGTDWRNETQRRPCILRRPCLILPTDGMDTKCNLGQFPPVYLANSAELSTEK